MNSPYVPRPEDYVGPDGRLKPSTPRPQRTLRQRAQRLIRDLPAAADSLNALPYGAAAAAPLRLAARGLTRATAPGATRATVTPAADPVLRGAYSPTPTVPAAQAAQELQRYQAGFGALHIGSRLGSTMQGRKVEFEDRDKKKGLTR